jgi:sugar lactone lactonase YvrE
MFSSKSFPAVAAACIILAGCAGIVRAPSSDSTLPQSSAQALRSSGNAAIRTPGGETNNVKVLNPAGGTIRAITYDGFQGTFAYALNDAGANVTLTMTNSGPNNIFGAPTPAGASPVLFLAAQVGGTKAVTFARGDSLGASISSASLVPAVSYTVYFYAGGSFLGSSLAFIGNPKREMLEFQTPLQDVVITPGVPLVMELVPTNAAAPGTLFVSNFNNNTVTLYTPPFSGSSQGLSATIASGVSEPDYVALDAGGNLYVANFGNGNVAIYAPPYSGSSSPVLTISNGLDGPNGVAVDSAGKLYVSNYYNGTVAIYTPPFIGPDQGLSATINLPAGEPYGMAFNSAGKLFVAVARGGVSVYAPPFTGASSPDFTISNGVSDPTGAAFDSKGNLYVTNNANSTVTIYKPPLSASSAPSATLTNGVQYPYQDAFDSEGNLYVANGWLSYGQQANTVTMYVPPFSGCSQGLTTTITSGLNFPNGIAVQSGFQASGRSAGRAPHPAGSSPCI